MRKFDFGIIGAGPAGYIAAIRASQLGKSVVIFEKENLGGVCLNKGCIPTKTILKSAELYNSLKKFSNFGIQVDNYSLDFEKVFERKEKTVEKIRKSLEMLLKSYEIEIVMSQAKVLDKNLVEAGNETYHCENILLALGAESKCVGGFDFDGEFILNSDDMLKLSKLPKSVVIVGSGAIGIEWARIFSSFQVEVSIVEIAENLLPLADFEVSQRLERIFKMSRVKMYLSNFVEKIEDRKVFLSSKEVLEPDFVLFATGRKPLELADEPTDNIKKIGDCSGEIQLAHYASHQALQTVENIVLGKKAEQFICPSVVYGQPEIAWVGKTEQELLKDKIIYKKSLFPLSALGKSQADGELEGFVKVLSSEEGLILGAHIISKEASAMIHQISIAMQNSLKIEDIKKCCFAHPTYSEGVFEAFLSLDDESLSLLRGQND